MGSPKLPFRHHKGLGAEGVSRTRRHQCEPLQEDRGLGEAGSTGAGIPSPPSLQSSEGCCTPCQPNTQPKGHNRATADLWLCRENQFLGIFTIPFQNWACDWSGLWRFIGVRSQDRRLLHLLVREAVLPRHGTLRLYRASAHFLAEIQRIHSTPRPMAGPCGEGMARHGRIGSGVSPLPPRQRARVPGFKLTGSTRPLRDFGPSPSSAACGDPFTWHCWRCIRAGVLHLHPSPASRSPAGTTPRHRARMPGAL